MKRYKGKRQTRYISIAGVKKRTYQTRAQFNAFRKGNGLDYYDRTTKTYYQVVQPTQEEATEETPKYGGYYRSTITNLYTSKFKKTGASTDYELRCYIFTNQPIDEKELKDFQEKVFSKEEWLRPILEDKSQGIELNAEVENYDKLEVFQGRIFRNKQELKHYSTEERR